MEDGVPRCPKCGSPMVYLVERERNTRGETRVTRYFRCPVCGTKVIDQQLLIKSENGTIRIISLINGSRRIVVGVRRAARPRRRARPVRPGARAR